MQALTPRPPQVDARPAGRAIMRVRIAMRRFAGYARTLQHWPLPRFSILATLVLGSTSLYGMTEGGHTTKVLDTVSEPLGFAINRVDVTGNSETSQIDILQALYMTGSQTLPSLDVALARQSIELMPWIAHTSVTKIYPDQVLIEVVEKKPFAIWQHEGDLTVVDHEGIPIVPFSTTRFTALPLIVGAGAQKAAGEFLDTLELVPELKPRVKAYIRVGERRWDLRLDNGMTIRLPEENAVEAAAEIVRLDRDMGVLSRDILAVDMRIGDRIVIRLTPEAKARRDAALKEREKLVKQAQREKPV